MVRSVSKNRSEYLSSQRQTERGRGLLNKGAGLDCDSLSLTTIRALAIPPCFTIAVNDRSCGRGDGDTGACNLDELRRGR